VFLHLPNLKLDPIVGPTGIKQCISKKSEGRCKYAGNDDRNLMVETHRTTLEHRMKKKTKETHVKQQNTIKLACHYGRHKKA